MRNQLQAAAGEATVLPATLVFDYPTARQLAHFFAPAASADADTASPALLDAAPSAGGLSPAQAGAGFERLGDCLLMLRSGASEPPPLFAVTSLEGTATLFSALTTAGGLYALQHEHLSTGDPAALAEATLPEVALKYAELIIGEMRRRAAGGAFLLTGVSFGSFLAHHVAVAAGSLGFPAAGIVLLEPWPVPPLLSPPTSEEGAAQAAAVLELFSRGTLGAPAEEEEEEEVLSAYIGQPEDALGPLMAERLARLGLQPFSTANILKAGRQIRVLVHHSRMWASAFVQPLAPLPAPTQVFAAFASEREDFFLRSFGAAPEESDASTVRRFYGTAMRDEVVIDGSHLEVGVRCATGREPLFAERLAAFLAAVIE
uniref:Carrier domain-containing protein n=1 Tax=Emiliania huxleyi TaxID=2903 RepID=A0A7S3TSX1_EMIHU